MPRVRKGAARNQQTKRLRRMTRGYQKSTTHQRGEMKTAIRTAGWYAYRDRRARKRDMRGLWITRLTAACKLRGTRYSVFMNGLKMSGIILNRKMLSQLAIEDPKTFDTICTTAVKNSRAGLPSAVPTTTVSKNPRSGQLARDIEAIEGIGPARAKKLRGINLGTVRAYLAAAESKAGRLEIAEKSGIDEKNILAWANMADLMRVDGVGPQFAELLEKSGVDSVKELANRVPANLASKMTEVNQAGAKRITVRAPTPAECEKWVAEAKTLAPAVSH